MRTVFVISYKYPNGEELKRTIFTLSLTLEFVSEILHGKETVEYIRISPRNL